MVAKRNEMLGKLCKKFNLSPQMLPGMKVSELAKLVGEITGSTNIDARALTESVKEYAAAN